MYENATVRDEERNLEDIGFGGSGFQGFTGFWSAYDFLSKGKKDVK